jgi:predicted PurR-regulated permease PerM
VLLLAMLVIVTAVPLSAAADRLERIHIPRTVGAPLILLAVLGLIVWGLVLLVPVFTSEGRRFVDSLPGIVADVRREFGDQSATSGNTGQQVQDYVNQYAHHPNRLLGPAATVGAGVAGIVTSLVVVIITALYSAVKPEPLRRGVLRLVTPPQRPHAGHIMHRLGRAYIGWLKGLWVGMALLWVLTYLGLLAVHLPFALVFATLTALAMVVPYYGALFSSIPPILFALTISPGKAVVVAAIYVVAHQVEGQLIEPLVMARAVELHPALVAIGVIAVERVFGPIGLIVAVPILVTCKILVEELWVLRIETRHRDAEVSSPPTGAPSDAPRFTHGSGAKRRVG